MPTKPMPITILRLGAPSAETCARLGGYEDWIAQNLTTATRSIDIIGGEAPPAHADCRGVILTGSAHSVNERQPWSEALRPWLQEAVARELPVFATCYGHQLLADALGGTVGANPNGMEIGNITLNRLPACDDDPLFAPLPATFSANAWHSESVLQLPPGAVALVANDHDPHHAYRLGKNAWGVQFHPEFAQEAMRDIIAQNRAHIADADALIAAVPAAQPHATALLQRFAQLALGA